MDETDKKGEYRTNIHTYFVYGGYELKFNQKGCESENMDSKPKLKIINWRSSS